LSDAPGKNVTISFQCLDFSSGLEGDDCAPFGRQEGDPGFHSALHTILARRFSPFRRIVTSNSLGINATSSKTIIAPL